MTIAWAYTSEQNQGLFSLLHFSIRPGIVLRHKITVTLPMRMADVFDIFPPPQGAAGAQKTADDPIDDYQEDQEQEVVRNASVHSLPCSQEVP